MVRQVAAEEVHVEGYIDGLFSRQATTEIGLLVGKLGVASRDFIFALIPTPPAEDTKAEQAAASSSGKKGAPKANVPLIVDGEWIAEHAQQVSRMLPGGIAIVGLYAFCSDPAFKEATPALCGALKGAVQASSGRGLEGGEERLLLHACSGPKKLTCRSCQLSGPSPSSLQPCELKMGRNLTAMQLFECTYSVHLRFPATSSTVNLRSAIKSAIASEATRLQSAQGSSGGSLINPGNLLGTERNPPHEVQLLVAPDWGNQDSKKEEELLGVVEIQGEIRGRAYVHGRETLGRAMTDLKADVLASLSARLELFCEEAEKLEGEAQGHPLLDPGKGPLKLPCAFVLPRRVFVPWLENVFVSDYLLEHEKLEDTTERCLEMLSLEIAQTSSIVEAESLGVVGADRISRGVSGQGHVPKVQDEQGVTRKETTCSPGMVAAILGAAGFALLAAVAASSWGV